MPALDLSDILIPVQARFKAVGLDIDIENCPVSRTNSEEKLGSTFDALNKDSITRM